MIKKYIYNKENIIYKNKKAIKETKAIRYVE